MKYRLHRGLVLVLLLAFALVSCAPKAVGPPLTPQEQSEKNAAVWLHMWNVQFNDHVAMSKLPNLTDEQKKILNRKADILEQSKPLLDLYVSAVKQGATPSSTTEQQLTTLMNQLSTMAIGFTQ